MPRWIGITLGLGLLLGGCALVGLNGYATWLQGGTWAVTAEGKIIASSTAIAIELIGVVLFGFAGGSAWIAGNRRIGFFSTCIMLVSGIAVVNSIASFQATERLSASRTRGAQIERIAEADSLAKSSATATLRAATGTRSRSARKDFIEANQDAIKAFRDAPVSVQVAPDAGAEMWAALFGFSVERIQMIQAGAQSVWQVLLSMACFHFAGFFMNPLAWLKPSTAASVKDRAKSNGGNGSDGDNSKPREIEDGKVVTLPVKSATPAQLQAPCNANEPEKVSAAPRVTVQAPPISLSLKSEPQTVAEYLAIHGSASSQKAIAQALGFSEAKVSRDIRKLRGQRKVEAKRIHRANNIVRNGGALHAFIA